MSRVEMLIDGTVDDIINKIGDCVLNKDSTHTDIARAIANDVAVKPKNAEKFITKLRLMQPNEPIQN